MWLVPITLYDDLTVSKGDRFQMTCNWSSLPMDETNTLWKALRWWSEVTGRGMEPLNIHLEKRIPTGAGLGGGSSDAGTLIRWLATENGLTLDQNHFSRIALRVGADVPFFVRGTPARVRGLGEILEPSPRCPPLDLVIVKPDISVATGWAYSEYDRSRSKLTQTMPTDSLPASIKSVEELGPFLKNDLEDAVVCRYPIVKEAKQGLLANGAVAAMMTGSGSAVFGVFENGVRAKQAMGVLQNSHPAWQVFQARTIQP